MSHVSITAHPHLGITISLSQRAAPGPPESQHAPALRDRCDGARGGRLSVLRREEKSPRTETAPRGRSDLHARERESRRSLSDGRCAGGSAATVRGELDETTRVTRCRRLTGAPRRGSLHHHTRTRALSSRAAARRRGASPPARLRLTPPRRRALRSRRSTHYR